MEITGNQSIGMIIKENHTMIKKQVNILGNIDILLNIMIKDNL